MTKFRFLLTTICISAIVFGAATADAKLHSATVTIDATSREAWTFFSFSAGTPVEVEDHTTSTDWDLGFQRTMVIVNGGVSGPRCRQRVGCGGCPIRRNCRSTGRRLRTGYRPNRHDCTRRWLVHLHRPAESLDSAQRSGLRTANCRRAVRKDALYRLLHRQRSKGRLW